MEEILTPQNMIATICVIIYCIVFIIQKAQFVKQNNIMNKYEKIFNIINIDEIEKYVELQKKSINLSLNNREIELTDKEKKIDIKFEEVNKILNSSKSTIEKSNEISERLNTILRQNKVFVEQINQLNIQEFKELYIIIEKFKISNSKEYKKIENEIINNCEKFDLLKREIVNKL
jgi:hypothetical protein